ncbi:MAG: response regulator, partial [Burkholderiaceae bacterium]
PPDLVLMDLQMPVMDGLTALRAMRADARWRAIPVLVLTGDVTVEQQQAALAAGAAAFLSKPMTREQLLAQVVRLGITPRPVAGGATPDVASDGASDVTSGAASDAASDAATDAPQGTPPLASQAAAPELVPNLEQLDELLLSVAINELDWGRTQIAATAATDGARMAQVAHRIKGTARELRCEPLVAAALALEQACKRDPQAGQGPWPIEPLLAAMAEVQALLAPRLDAVTQR